MTDSGAEARSLIEAERRRQVAVEGWNAEHDDEHAGGELLTAAEIYLHHGTDDAGGYNHEADKPIGWPWSSDWWKPKDRRRNLERAGALMLAEKERLGRVHWREFKGYETIHSQPNPVRVYIPRIGMQTDHVDHKLDICIRELSALLEAGQ